MIIYVVNDAISYNCFSNNDAAVCIQKCFHLNTLDGTACIYFESLLLQEGVLISFCRLPQWALSVS